MIPLLIAATLAGCATSRAFRRGQDAARLGDWDAAVVHYRQALADDPDRVDVRVALTRATQSAALDHLTRARTLESEGQLAAAAAEYRRVIELEPANQLAAAKATEMDRKLRDEIDATRPKPEIDRLREQVRKEQETAALPLNQRLPRFNFAGATLREVLEFIAEASNVNIIIDPEMQAGELNRPVVLTLQDNTVDEVLRYLSTIYRLFYRTLDQRTILVAVDNARSRLQYEEQSIQTFYLSHSKAIEVGNILTQMLRSAPTAGAGSLPMIIAHEGNNTVTVRAPAGTMQIVEHIVRTNDRPKAEVVIEVTILEVDRARAKEYGLDLSSYAVGVTVSPEVVPSDAAPPPPINADTLAQGIRRSDVYLTVPAAIVRFLEQDTNTRLLAKSNLRGQEAATLTLNLGDEVPVPTTTFGTAAGGGLATIPIAQFDYRPVGINLVVKPDVTYEGEIILELTVESSGLGPNIVVAGQALPSFSARKVQTTLRLRDGESNMLAGLLREEERKTRRGLPGLIRVPFLRELFASNDSRVDTSDIVMLLTPRIVRTHEITADDIRPINAGTSQNMNLGGAGPVFSGLATTGEPVPAMDRTIAGAPSGGVPAPPVAAAPGAPRGALVPPAGAVQRPVADLPAAPEQPARPPAPTTPAEVVITAAPMTVGTLAAVPITIANASRLSQVTISVAYDTTVLRARGVTQGPFMGQGGQQVSMLPRIDEAAGRIEIVLARTGDTAGVSGAGLLASIQFEPIAAGEGSLAVTGAATSPEGQMLPVQFVPGQFRIR
ncbi:MAG: secretin N-terminal domain-containing protein [Vicinamibacterales bacterium]